MSWAIVGLALMIVGSLCFASSDIGTIAGGVVTFTCGVLITCGEGQNR